jgi:hypothetical protein
MNFNVALTDNKVVYTVLTGTGTTELMAIPKTGGTPLVLDSVPAGTVSLVTAGVRVYFNISDATGVTAKVMREDGTLESSIANAEWVGGSYSNKIAFGPQPSPARFILAKGMNGSSIAGSTLKSIDAATNLPVASLGTVPSNIELISFVGYGDDLLALGWSGFSSPALLVINVADIFFINTQNANSLVRLTSSPDKIESSIQNHFPAFFATF